MDQKENKAYQKGYRAGLDKRWPKTKPPYPPHELVRSLMEAVNNLRDSCDSICAALDEEDEWFLLMDPLIDKVDEANKQITKWLTEK